MVRVIMELYGYELVIGYAPYHVFTLIIPHPSLIALAGGLAFVAMMFKIHWSKFEDVVYVPQTAVDNVWAPPEHY